MTPLTVRLLLAYAKYYGLSPADALNNRVQVSVSNVAGKRIPGKEPTAG